MTLARMCAGLIPRKPTELPHFLWTTVIGTTRNGPSRPYSQHNEDGTGNKSPRALRAFGCRTHRTAISVSTLRRQPRHCHTPMWPNAGLLQIRLLLVRFQSAAQTERPSGAYFLRSCYGARSIQESSLSSAIASLFLMHEVSSP